MKHDMFTVNEMSSILGLEQMVKLIEIVSQNSCSIFACETRSSRRAGAPIHRKLTLLPIQNVFHIVLNARFMIMVKNLP